MTSILGQRSTLEYTPSSPNIYTLFKFYPKIMVDSK
jgi:hypothetical protein